jgi:hypothetical protein
MRPVALDDPAHFGIDRFMVPKSVGGWLPAPPVRAGVLGKIPSAYQANPDAMCGFL